MRMRDKRKNAKKRQKEGAVKWHERICPNCKEGKPCQKMDKLKGKP